MSRKNPFDHSGRPAKPAVTTPPARASVTTSSRPVNPFDRSKSTEGQATVKSAMGVVKMPAKSTIEKWQAIVAKRKAGLNKAVAGKKLTIAEPARAAGSMQTAGGGMNGSSEGGKSALGGSSSSSQSSTFGRDSFFGRNSIDGTPAEGSPALTGTEYRKAWVIADPMAASNKDEEKISQTAMTASNYQEIYKEETLGMKGAATHDMNSDNYTQIYKAQKGYIGDATEQMNSDNYTEVYKQREEQRVVKEKAAQVVKQQEIAVIEIRKQEQKKRPNGGASPGALCQTGASSRCPR